ncbi:MAG: MarR family transcriptional regulator [Verrucomicrobiota bacterium]|nr:MarR family transcriptional regulator [Verrucomicrobiota bacterium]
MPPPKRFDPIGLGPLLHGTAHAWRLKLDARLRPMGLSQAKWRTLLHLARATAPPTQAEIANKLGIEEPSLVTLLHRLEHDGWVVRRSVAHDRRCKTVHLRRRAHNVIEKIDQTARELRQELTAAIPRAELDTCMRVLREVQARAEEFEENGQGAAGRRAKA